LLPVRADGPAFHVGAGTLQPNARVNVSAWPPAPTSPAAPAAPAASWPWARPVEVAPASPWSATWPWRFVPASAYIDASGTAVRSVKSW